MNSRDTTVLERSAEVLASPAMERDELKRIIEAALLAAQEPLSVSELRKLFEQDPGAEALKGMLEEIRDDWTARGVELVAVASGWRFRTRTEMQPFLDRLNPQKPPRYSRAVLETLAIIAYRQPVTRGDIEQVRGVTVSGNIVKALETRGWIEVIGHREAPGRPALYATTRQFLDDLELRSVEDLPPLDDLASLIESNVPLETSIAQAELPLGSNAEPRDADDDEPAPASENSTTEDAPADASRLV